MKAQLFILILFIIGLFTKSMIAQTMTLRQCIETAHSRNATVQQASLQVENTAVNVNQAKANRLPSVNAGFGYGLNQGRTVDPITNNYINQQLASSNVNLDASVVVYNGLRLQNLIKQNGFSHEAAKMDAQQIKDNLTLNVILAYLQVLSNEDVLAIAKAQIEVTKKQVERSEKLLREGSLGLYQLAELKGQQSNEALNIVNFDNALQQAKLALCTLMQVDFNPNMVLERETSVALPVEQGALTAEDVYQNALQSLALIKANALRMKSAEVAVQVANAGYYPSVSINANLGSGYSSIAQQQIFTDKFESTTGDFIRLNGNQIPVLSERQNVRSEKIGYFRQLDINLGTFIGLNVQIPIFNNFINKNRLTLARLAVQNARLNADNDKITLRQNIEQAWLNRKAAADRYAVLREQTGHFEEAFRAAEVRFANGVINPVEYLVVKNNLDRVKISLAQTKYDYIFRQKLLDFYQGRF